VTTSVDDVSVEETWRRLTSDPAAVLIDVRTRAEWTYVGVPHLGSIGKETILAEWQEFPGNRVHTDFAERLSQALAERGTTKDADLFFLCRSGVRSLAAARAMAALGHARCHNVTGGFEGQLDADRHRGRLEGWKAAGLPWVQG
jgi:rhodanese-related sulfurtransferase